MFLKWVTSLNSAPFLILVALAGVLGAIDPRILSGANIASIVIVAAPVALIALATMVVLVSGGIDLSLGMAVTFCCIVIATVLTATGSLPLALGAGLLAALVIGVANGFLVGVLAIPPFVATLATMIMLQGMTLYFAQSGVLIVNSAPLKAIGQGNIFGFPAIVIFALAVAGLCAFVLKQTPFGLRIYSVGSDTTALQLSGLSIARQLVATYVFASVFAFICAVALIGRVPIVTPTMGGTSLLLDGLSAAVLGGVSMFGGRGTVIGVICGALAVSLITAATQIFGLDPSAIGLVKGSIVLAALGTDQVLSRISGAYMRTAG